MPAPIFVPPAILNLRGAITALITPFAADGALDTAAWQRLVTRQVEAGCGLVVAGSTGESAALDEAEFEALIGSAVAVAGSPVIAGCGASATHRARALLVRAARAGAAAALVVTPPYVRPTQEGLYRHYAALADSGVLPLILYNVPARTGCDLEPATVARLASHPNIIGIKEAVADPRRMEALLALRRADFRVLSGDDGSALQSLRAGADGVISVASNVMPYAWQRLCRLLAAGDGEGAAALGARMAPVLAALALEPNPIPVKWMLHVLELAPPGLRLPLTELSVEHRASVEAGAQLAAAIEADSRAARTHDAAA